MTNASAGLVRGLALVSALSVGVVGIASADSEPTPAQREEAREHFERGKELYGSGKYEDAIQEYLAAYKIASFPELVFNIAQAYRLSGDAVEALKSYELFLQQQPDGALADEARAHVLDLRSRARTTSTTEASPDDDGQGTWSGFNADLDAGSRADAEADAKAFAYRRSRWLFGLDVTMVILKSSEGGGGSAMRVSALGGYYRRLRPKVVFEPRALLGAQTALGDNSSSVHVEVQARLLVFPTPWLLFGIGVGGGASTCAVLGAFSGGTSTAHLECQPGVEGSASVEVGIFAAEHYEVSVAVHPISLLLLEDDAPSDILAPIGVSVAYHL